MGEDLYPAWTYSALYQLKATPPPKKKKNYLYALTRQIKIRNTPPPFPGEKNPTLQDSNPSECQEKGWQESKGKKPKSYAPEIPEA